jgi:hypothetical protein
VIAEPPIDEGDTRPRPAAAFMPPPVAEPVAPVDVEEEPEFLDRMIDPSIDLSRFEPPRAPSDTQPRKAVEAPAAPLDEAEAAADAKPEPAAKAETASEQPTVATVEFAQEETQLELEPEAPSASDEQTAPSATEAASILEEIPPVTESLIENALTSSASETEQEPEATAPTPAQEPNAEAKSIWEVFGLPRPSETQETAAASLKPEPVPASSEPVSEPEQPAVEAVFEDQALPEKPSLPRGSSRTGLRIVLRRKLVRVRRP